MIAPSSLRKTGFILTALHELGMRQLSFYLLYQLELRSGLMRRWTQNRPLGAEPLGSPARLLTPLGAEQISEYSGLVEKERTISEAAEIRAGKVRLFGSIPVPLQLSPPAPLLHWTEYEGDKSCLFTGDVKLVWEPARFGWAYQLARAYQLTGDECYPATFWKSLEEFLRSNPPYLGLNWVSAQEVALRLITWVFCWQVFASSPHSTPERGELLAQAIAVHAQRIPPSLAYARAQNNNHLLSEAAGLYTAGLALPDFPAADRWRKLGWRLFHLAVRDQIDADGTYCQHSMNYHRLMLQLALWMKRLADGAGQHFPARSIEKLAAATGWLSSMVDPISGGAPNLGPNDGAYVLPLTSLGQGDFRPVLQAAGQIFLGKRLLRAGPWDEMGAWFGATVDSPDAILSFPPAPSVMLSPAGDSRAYLRAVKFSGRPGHADQLHVDLWWRGENIARDAGTYLYNAPDPWDNALAGTDVHNTVTVDGQDQMRRAGRFLFLGRAQASIIIVNRGTDQNFLVAEHNGYHKLGLIHRRILSQSGENIWTIEDEIFSKENIVILNEERNPCLHWLLPDWPWEMHEEEDRFRLCQHSHSGMIEIELQAWSASKQPTCERSIQLIRAGELVYGSGELKQYWGWFSPTYNEKTAALSVRVSLQGKLPLFFKTCWKLG